MNNNTTLLGGTEIAVNKLDGTEERVFVRQVPVRHFPKLLESLADEFALARIYTQKDDAWLDALAPEAFEKIITEGERLNSDFFSRWWDRTRARVERVAPGEFQRMMGLVSRTSAPKSPSDAD
jgi:hypothetical protein